MYTYFFLSLSLSLLPNYERSSPESYRSALLRRCRHHHLPFQTRRPTKKHESIILTQSEETTHLGRGRGGKYGQGKQTRTLKGGGEGEKKKRKEK